MKIAIVDDEQVCLDELTQLCHNFGIQNQCLTEIISFTSGEAFLKALDNDSFSVVFMDIFMKGTDGITASQKLRELDSGCILVFVTSSMDFMPDAFSCHAFEYITKPFSQQRITKVLKDALNILPPSRKYIEVSSDRKTVPVFLDDIISVVTDAHYLTITLTNGNVLRSRMTMQEFFGQASRDSRFIPVNKGITVNADYILDFENSCCILENGARLPIRVRDRLKTEQAVRDYHFNKIRSCQRHRKEN